MYLSVKEKEKYVIELRKQGKSYPEIAHELKISPRDISKILKKVSGELEEKERKKIVLSKTAQALQLFKRGKSPIDVAIKLDLNTQEVQILYHDYLILNNRHCFVGIFEEFDNDSLQDFIEYDRFMKENGIGKKEIIEGIKKSNDYPKIKDEYEYTSNKLKELKGQKENYLADNKILMYKYYELNKKYTSLVPKIESAKKKLQLTENEFNKIKSLLESIKKSEDYINLKNKVKEQVNEFLNQKNEFFQTAIRLILDTIKADPEKHILINNILYANENPNSVYFLLAYEEKIAKITNALYDAAIEINTNKILE